MFKKTSSTKSTTEIKKSNPPNSHNDGSKKVDGNRDGGRDKPKSFEKGVAPLSP